MVEIERIFTSQDDTKNSLYERSIELGLLNRKFDQSRIGLLFSVFAAEFELLISVMNQYVNQYSIELATDQALLESMLKPWVSRDIANNPKAFVVITRNSGYNEEISFPAGTEITSLKDSSPVYTLSEDITFYKGEKQIRVLTHCTEAGSRFNVEANELVELAVDRLDNDEQYDIISQFTVTNPYPSWGGKDDELLENARKRAMNFRYNRDGTQTNIQNQMDRLGLTYRDYALKEYWGGYGSVLIALDIDNPYEFDDISDELEIWKVYGIKYHVIRAKRIYLDMSVTLTLIGETDITSKERAELYSQCDEGIREYFSLGINIGQGLSIDQLRIYILRRLIDNTNLVDVNIQISNQDVMMDNKRILADDITVLYPNKVTTFLNYEGG